MICLTFARHFGNTGLCLCRCLPNDSLSPWGWWGWMIWNSSMSRHVVVTSSFLGNEWNWLQRGAASYLGGLEQTSSRKGTSSLNLRKSRMGLIPFDTKFFLRVSELCKVWKWSRGHQLEFCAREDIKSSSRWPKRHYTGTALAWWSKMVSARLTLLNFCWFCVWKLKLFPWAACFAARYQIHSSCLSPSCHAVTCRWMDASNRWRNVWAFYVPLAEAGKVWVGSSCNQKTNLFEKLETRQLINFWATKEIPLQISYLQESLRLFSSWSCILQPRIYFGRQLEQTC